MSIVEEDRVTDSSVMYLDAKNCLEPRGRALPGEGQSVCVDDLLE